MQDFLECSWSSASELTSAAATRHTGRGMRVSTARTRRKPRASSTRRAAHTSVKPSKGERYTPLRRAEFLLNNAATEAEYAVARREVQALGIDPDTVPHVLPNPR